MSRNINRPINSCRDACRMCAVCDGRNYEQCYDACRQCDKCTGNYSPYYAPPRYTELHRYGGIRNAEMSSLYGRLSRNGRYINQSIPAFSDCESICGYSVSREYNNRMEKYNRCLDSYSRKTCNEKYGCKNWRGFELRNTPPINPKYTGCQPCWTSGSYSYYS